MVDGSRYLSDVEFFQKYLALAFTDAPFQFFYQKATVLDSAGACGYVSTLLTLALPRSLRLVLRLMLFAAVLHFSVTCANRKICRLLQAVPMHQCRFNDSGRKCCKSCLKAI